MDKALEEAAVMDVQALEEAAVTDVQVIVLQGETALIAALDACLPERRRHRHGGRSRDRVLLIESRLLRTRGGRQRLLLGLLGPLLGGLTLLTTPPCLVPMAHKLKMMRRGLLPPLLLVLPGARGKANDS